MTNGHLVISLDFELHWGVFDAKSVESYRENLLQVHTVIPKMLQLADAYDIKLTFSTVGFLFAENKTMLRDYLPDELPTYLNQKLNPYLLMDGIGYNEKEDPFHYGLSLIKMIQQNGNHEIGTHTFSHFYCNEEGQNVNQFENDIKSAISIAKNFGVEPKSIVFPRNMVQANSAQGITYLNVCKKYGLIAYRGNEKSKIYDIYSTTTFHDNFLNRITRILDCYFNITGQNTYDILKINSKEGIINLPSSRFLRPYFKPLKWFEPLKLKRIESAMEHAAKNNELYHLWWHPHNFGSNMDKNFENLEAIFKIYTHLNKAHNFKSETMTGLAHTILSNRI